MGSQLASCMDCFVVVTPAAIDSCRLRVRDDSEAEFGGAFLSDRSWRSRKAVSYASEAAFDENEPMTHLVVEQHGKLAGSRNVDDDGPDACLEAAIEPAEGEIFA